MNGKVIKLNDYKFNFGQETIFLNVFAVFKSIKNGNKYIIYSYDNKKLYCGSAFVKNNEIIKLKINIIINNTAANFFMIFLFLK